MINRDDFERACVDKRILCLRNTIDERDKEFVCSSIRHFNNISDLPITLFIDSQGGDVTREGFIVDAICFSDVPVHGIVEGHACSAAFGILQACHLRKAYPSARLMFHAPIIKIQIDDEAFDSELARLRGIHEDQIREFASRSKRPEAAWREWARKERFFSAQEALEVGMIDEIIAHPRPMFLNPA